MTGNIALIRVFENGLDDQPYSEFFSVDVYDAWGQYLGRVGTFSKRQEANQVAADLSVSSGAKIGTAND